MIGLFITLFAGICLSLFSPAFNLATNDQWSTLPKGVPKLVVYTAFFYFSIAGFLIALILNLIFLYRPMVGLARSSLKKYVNDSKGRGWAVFAGFLCGFGNGLQFMGGQAAGYAAADSVQVCFYLSVSISSYRLISSLHFGFEYMSSVFGLGTSSCEHILGHNFVWRVSEILEENLCAFG